MWRVVPDDDQARTDLAAGLDEIVREGARRMLAEALEAEVAAVIENLSDQVDEAGPPAGASQWACSPAAGDHRCRSGDGVRPAGR